MSRWAGSLLIASRVKHHDLLKPLKNQRSSANCPVCAREIIWAPDCYPPPVSSDDRPFNGSSVHLISTGDSAQVPDSGLPLSVLEFGLTDSVHTGA